jgi:hypothetical protein
VWCQRRRQKKPTVGDSIELSHEIGRGKQDTQQEREEGKRQDRAENRVYRIEYSGGTARAALFVTVRAALLVAS